MQGKFSGVSASPAPTQLLLRRLPYHHQGALCHAAAIQPLPSNPIVRGLPSSQTTHTFNPYHCRHQAPAALCSLAVHLAPPELPPCRCDLHQDAPLPSLRCILAHNPTPCHALPPAAAPHTAALQPPPCQVNPYPRQPIAASPHQLPIRFNRPLLLYNHCNLISDWAYSQHAPLLTPLPNHDDVQVIVPGLESRDAEPVHQVDHKIQILAQLVLVT